jgi:tetratricopeptide (TPR) repeat protein
VLSDYRQRIAFRQRQFASAEHIQRLVLDVGRRSTASIIGKPTDALSSRERLELRALAITLISFGDILFQQRKTDCLAIYEEAHDLALRLDDQSSAASAAFNLGTAHLNLPGHVDVDAAERWYQECLDRTPQAERLKRAVPQYQLGRVALERMRLARAEGREGAEVARLLEEARRRYVDALTLIPDDAVNDLAVVNHQLGVIYAEAGNADRALAHFAESIRMEELQGNTYGAAQTRLDVARLLALAGRLEDAHLYAEAAAKNYASLAPVAEAELAEARRLVQSIEQMQRG